MLNETFKYLTGIFLSGLGKFFIGPWMRQAIYLLFMIFCVNVAFFENYSKNFSEGQRIFLMLFFKQY